MVSEDKTDTYGETVSRTTSEPPTEVTVTEERAITTLPSSDVETFEVQSVTTREEESVSAKASEADVPKRPRPFARQKDQRSNEGKSQGIEGPVS